MNLFEDLGLGGILNASYGDLKSAEYSAQQSAYAQQLQMNALLQQAHINMYAPPVKIFPRSEDMKDHIMNRRMQRKRDQIERRHTEQMNHLGAFAFLVIALPLFIALVAAVWRIAVAAVLS